MSRTLAGSLVLLLVMGLLSLTNLIPAFAAATYQITGQWASNTPAQVAPGAVVTAEWRVNVNDDAAAPSNAPVDNVTVTLTATHGKFAGIPDVCMTTGVTPPSSISADGTTLVCNLGTQNMGTAVAIQTPITSDGVTGDQLSVSGSIGGATASLAAVPIVGKFGMDIKWSESGNWTLDNASGNIYFDYEWTLNLLKGSPAGPNSVSYTVTMDHSLGGSVLVNGCGPFTMDTKAGHPWSGGSHPADQMAPFVGSCTLTATGTPNIYTMTLTGINYSQTQVPTKDAAGNNLPTDRVAIASGRVQVQIAKPTQGVTVGLTSSAPTYTSAVGGLTSTDDSSNNTTRKVWTSAGGWGSAWIPPYSGSAAASYSDTFRAPTGTEIWDRQATQLHSGLPASTVIQLCTALDTADVTLSSTPIQTYLFEQPSTLTPEQNRDLGNNPFAVSPHGPVNGLTFYYYVGNDPRVTAGSAGYNPAAFSTDCNTDAANWTTTRPADLSTVKAIRTQYAAGSVASNEAFFVHTPVIINDDTAAGTDIWQTSSYRVGTGAWTAPPTVLTNTPGSQYPATTYSRDVMRVTLVAPFMEKSVDRASVKPGEPAVYTINYAANGDASAPPTVDGFVVTDTLPVGMTYVAGSASPAPVVTTNGSGRQVLTWTFNGVPINVLHALTYQAVAGSDAVPGQTLTNSVTGAFGGLTSSPAYASVTVSTNGSTAIGKTADTAFIPNVAGDGSGAGSWTVTLRSYDPTPQAFTDTIDILPYNGDGRGTTVTGSYALTGVTAVAGATVYYTTADPATLSDDPAAAANGSAGSVTGNTVGWTTTQPANPTAVRVIGPALAPGATQSFTLGIQTTGATGGDVLVNKAQARAEHTELGMLTSAPITVAKHYTASLKKEVQDKNGVWHDANDVVDYPAFRTGDTVPYRITVTNVGQGTLTNIVVADDQYPAEGGFTIASLAPGATQTHEFSTTLGAGIASTFVNTASASADVPADSQVAPTINIDPAGIEVANYTTVKTSDPASGTTVTSGQKITYTVTVTQSGSAPANASFADDLTAVLDNANYNNDVAASTGTATPSGSGLSWNGTVPVGGTATITYSVTVKTPMAGDLTLTNAVTSQGCVPVNGQTPDCTTTHHVGPLITCTSDPNLFNTAYNAGTGGKLPVGSVDTNWRVSDQIAVPHNTLYPVQMPSGSTTWNPGNVVGQVTGPSATDPVGGDGSHWAQSPYGNADWISRETTSTQAQSFGVWYYQYQFVLDPAVDPSKFSLRMDFLADNAVMGVFINGVNQGYQQTPNAPTTTDSGPATGPFFYPGYIQSNAAQTTLNQNWQTGLNTLTIQLDSHITEGFLAQVQPSPLCSTKFLIEKIGESSDSTWVPMAGSTWAIHDDANGAPGAVNPSYPVEAVPAETGRFRVEGIEPGAYWLEETTAPDGFSLLAEPVQFTVAANGAVTVGEGSGGGVVTAGDEDGDGIFLLTVRDVPALQLPESGSTGPWPFMAGGAALLLAAVVLAAGSVRRRRNEPAA